MRREKFKWQPHKNESTDTEHRGGSVFSSEEISVMEVERRNGVIELESKFNQKWEEF
jgi:hypothetical protein